MVKRMLTRTVVALSLAAVTPLLTAAQIAEPAFEVASIRQAEARVPAAMTVTDGRVDVRNYPLYRLVLAALRAEPFQVSAPQWLTEPSLTEGRFDIQAVVPEGATREQVPDMLRALLVERFGLITHVERRPVPVYELVVGNSGIKVPEVEPRDELTKEFPVDPGRRVTSDSTDNEQRVIRMPPITRYITARTLYETSVDSGRWKLDATRITMAELAGVLRSFADRPVIDNTGLAGVYQFKLELPQTASAARVRASLGLTTDVNGNPIDPNPSGMTVFKAVETLGLKLEDRRSALDVIVIDKIDRAPTAN